MVHTFSFPTQIRFGPGASREAGRHLREHAVSRPLVVTDRGLSRLPLLAGLVEGLRADGLDPSVFDGVFGNPTQAQVGAGVAAFRGHEADGIVGVGGGAALDVAKAVALMVHHPGDLFDYEDGRPSPPPVDREVPLWVAVPTTSGTGSEVGRSAVVSDDATGVKKVIFSPRLLAPAVFADPELTLGVPPAVTAATGLDALTHCIEAYLARDYHPLCEGIALEGLRIGARALPRCVENGADLAARQDMMMCAMMGAIAFQKGLGLVHSCAHALSTVAGLHHGYANGLMIDHALPFNLEAAADRFRVLARTVELEDEDGPAFLAWLRALKRRIGVPATLAAAEVPREVGRLAELAFTDTCHLNNPRLCTREDFQGIFERAFA